jgi:hypothetical protein
LQNAVENFREELWMVLEYRDDILRRQWGERNTVDHPSNRHRRVALNDPALRE